MTRLRLRSVLLRCCLLGALISATGPSRAAPPPGGSPPAAAALRQKARISFFSKRWADAEASFEAALAAPDAAGMTEVQQAEVLGYLGLSELEQGKHREAAEHLGESLEHDAALKEPLVRRFTAGFNKALEHVGRIYVAAAPPDAEVLLDDEPIGTGATVLELFVDPGKHTLRARLSGYEELSHRVEIAGGATIGATLTLSRVAPAPPRTPEPSATKRGPVGPAAAPAPGPWASWPGTLRIAGIAVTTAAISSGTVFMLRANVLDRDIDERGGGLNRDPASTWDACRQVPQPSACPELHRLRVQRDTSRVLGAALVATGVVVGAATVVSFFAGSSSPRAKAAPAALHVLPVTTAQQIGVVALGAW
ncbi:PEGA domain-containing protein [Sorangium sp. So ce1504]|uniref:PEGA domain-containing protein n=1 Tax=Sorangium sp. So ce1504 TaxID=3133337 RepID=UPI003F6058DF